jgi:hypothetical protein
VDGGLRGANVRAAAARQGLNLRKSGQGRRVVQIVGYREILAEILERQHRKARPRFIHGELTFLHVALLVRHLRLGHDAVAMRRFAAAFELLGDVHELLCLTQALPRVGYLRFAETMA